MKELITMAAGCKKCKLANYNLLSPVSNKLFKQIDICHVTYFRVNSMIKVFDDDVKGTFNSDHSPLSNAALAVS